MTCLKRTVRISCLAVTLITGSCMVQDTDNAVAADIYSLNAVKARYGFPVILQKSDRITLKSNYTEISFLQDSRQMFFNGTLVWLNDGIARKGKDWSISKTDSDLVISPLLTSRRILAGSKISVIVLDPGHGGRDTGAIGKRKVYEKKAVLDIAKKVKALLKNSGITVRLTRETDKALSLGTRTALARQWKADLFLSIHLNSAGNSRAEGIETFVMSNAGKTSTSSIKADKKSYQGNRHDKQNIILAYNMQKGLLARTKAVDRGIKKARFEVLKEAPCPAALVECAFISNSKEEAKIITKEYRQKIAEGIAEGIRSYIALSE